MKQDVKILQTATLHAFRIGVNISKRTDLDGWDVVQTDISNLVIGGNIQHSPGIRALGLWKHPQNMVALNEVAGIISCMRFIHQGVLYRGNPATIEELDAFYMGANLDRVDKLSTLSDQSTTIHALGEKIDLDGRMCTPKAYVGNNQHMVMGLQVTSFVPGHEHYHLVSFRVDGGC